MTTTRAYLTSNASTHKATDPLAAARKEFGYQVITIKDSKNDRHWEVYTNDMLEFLGDIWVYD